MLRAAEKLGRFFERLRVGGRGRRRDDGRRSENDSENGDARTSRGKVT